MSKLDFGHIADLHFSERFQLAGQLVLGEDGLNIRLTDVEKCVDAFGVASRAHASMFNLIVGDVFDHPRAYPNEEKVAIRAIDRLAKDGDVFIIPGNHDSGGPLEAPAVTCLVGRRNIHVALRPGYWDSFFDEEGAWSVAWRYLGQSCRSGSPRNTSRASAPCRGRRAQRSWRTTPTRPSRRRN